jgi:hypothetical protein
MMRASTVHLPFINVLFPYAAVSVPSKALMVQGKVSSNSLKRKP